VHLIEYSWILRVSIRYIYIKSRLDLISKRAQNGQQWDQDDDDDDDDDDDAIQYYYHYYYSRQKIRRDWSVGISRESAVPIALGESVGRSTRGPV